MQILHKNKNKMDYKNIWKFRSVVDPSSAAQNVIESTQIFPTRGKSHILRLSNNFLQLGA
jgi:hypothetical protein